MLEHEYPRFLAACNRRDWSTVRGFFDGDVIVNGEHRTVEGYVEDMVRLCLHHPDHLWSVVDVRRAGDVITACLTTDRSGEQGVEFVQYRSAGTAIVELWTLGSMSV